MSKRRLSSRGIVLALVTLALLVAGATAAQAKVYITGSLLSEGKFVGVGVQRANFDGSGLETIQSEPTGFENGVAVDVPDGKLFWADTSAETIRESNLNGTGVHNLVNDSGGAPRGVAVDPENKKIYWTETGTNKGISKINMDGTEREHLTSEPSFGYIAIDIGAQVLYWADSGSEKIFRASIAKTLTVETIVENQPHAFGVAVEPAIGKVYWEEISGSDTIRRANLNGTSPETVVTRSKAGMDGGLAVDGTTGKIYWNERTPKTVGAANLDGSSPGVLFSTPGISGEGIAVEATNPKPVNTVAPSIAGAHQVGSQDSCHVGGWSGTGPITFSYQWGVVGGTTIEGATASTFTPTTAQQGHQLVCIVTAKDSVESTTATSGAVTVGGFPSAIITRTPLIVGFVSANMSSKGSKAKVPVFTDLAGTATLKASPVTGRKAARSARKKRSTRPKTVTVTASLKAGRGSISLSKLLRGTTYKLTLTVKSADGQSAADKATLKVSKH
jgi:DNA-binding beta-propeller fold protein YncE